MNEQPAGTLQDFWSVVTGNKQLQGNVTVGIDTKSILILAGSILVVGIIIIIIAHAARKKA